MKRLLIILCLIASYQAWQWAAHRPVPQADGVLIANAPLQTPALSATPFVVGDFTLTPLAHFSLEARVLLISRYRWDTESKLAPYDLGVGWQRMSDSAVLRGLSLSQSARFLLWRWREAPPIPETEITRSAANIHIIPASPDIESRIADLRPGQLVALKGVLVEAVTQAGWRWRSSQSREDGGSGACELMYVEDLAIH
jgi:hypothetical protein